MNRITNLALVLITFFTFISCSKEYSLEKRDATIPEVPVTTNCILQKLVEADPATDKGEYAFISTYDPANLVTRVELVDSTSNSVDNSFAISRPDGRVQIDAEQYFVIDLDSNVTEFHGREEPTDPTSQMITARYTYNASGQITTRETEYDSLPGVVLTRIEYTYTGNNLTTAEFRAFDGFDFSKVGEIAYEYDETENVKPFLRIYAFDPELFYFQTAVKAGPQLTNPIKKTIIQLQEPGTDNVYTNTTEYVNYNVDTNSYVTSFEVTGDSFIGLYSGKKYKLEYHCY